MPILRHRIRVAADISQFTPPVDVITNETPALWKGTDVQFELAIFDNGALQTPDNLTSLTLELRAALPNGQAPDAGDAPVLAQTIDSATINTALLLADWNAGTDQHVLIAFTGLETNFTAGDYWLSVYAVTDDVPGQTITLVAGALTVSEDGAGLSSAPTPPEALFYDAAQSDARFEQQGVDFADVANVTSGQYLRVKNASVTTDAITVTNLKDVVIDGQGATVTLNNGINNHLLKIGSGCERVTLRNFNFHGPDTGVVNWSFPHYGVSVGDGAADICIEHCTFSGFDKYSIHASTLGGAQYNRGLLVSRCGFFDSQFDSFFLALQTAVFLDDNAHYSTIDKCRFRNVPTAVRAEAANVIISDNIITECNGGPASGSPLTSAGLIYFKPVTAGGNSLICGNRINHNAVQATPIRLSGSAATPGSNFIVTDNFVRMNTVAADAREALVMTYCNNAVISRNNFHPADGSAGAPCILLSDSDNAQLAHNLVFNGTFGLEVSASSGNSVTATLWGNNFSGNTSGDTTTSGTGTATITVK